MTDFLGQFHFLRPLWLLAFIPLAIVVWMMVTRRLGSRSWESVCDRALLPHILMRMPSRTRRLAELLTLVGGTLAILALAGPAWQRLPQPVFTPQSALVIALDLTRSMDATDVTPSRVVRARYKIADILDQRKEGQTALLVYSGDAFTVTPLTDDGATIKSQLTALDPSIMPATGNRTDLAISHARDLLQQAGFNRGDILVITDEVNLDPARKAAAAVHKQGYRVSVLGVGTTHGAPVPLEDGSFLKDRSGEIVIPVLEEKPMRELAGLGGGSYMRMSLDDTDIKALQRILNGVSPADGFAQTRLRTDVWKEQGPWLLLALLPLAAVIFRRGYLALILIFFLPFPHNANAFDWDSLWLNRDMRAEHALQDGDHKRAAQLFTRPRWKGPAQYQAQDYQGALQSLHGLEDSDSHYNAGNALARLGRYEEAIKAYDQALRLDPDNKDARYNRELVKKELQNQKQQQQQKQKQQGQKRKQGKKQGQQQQQDREQGSASNKQQGDNKQQQDNNHRQSAGNSQQGQHRQDQEQKADQDKRQAAENKQQQKNNPAKQAASDAKEKEGEEPARNMSASRDKPPDEREQAIEQWLRRIPDDPAGLLRRKFLYQYRQRAEPPAPGDKTW